MTAGTWWLYATLVFFVSATPGPNMLHVMTRSIQLGLRRSLWAMAGCMSAILVALTLSATGLGALLTASPRLFDVLRYAGVAYLVWLGIKAWRGAGRAPDVIGDDPQVVWPGDANVYRTALLTGLSNPKLIVFAGALFPQFIRADQPRLLQFVLLVGTFVVIESFWYAVYAIGGRGLARHLAAPGRQKLFDRITGGLFIGFGVALLGARA